MPTNSTGADVDLDMENRNVLHEEIAAICKTCGEPCRLVQVDFGIGVTEAWGVLANDVQLEIVSACCHEDYETRSESNETV